MNLGTAPEAARDSVLVPAPSAAAALPVSVVVTTYRRVKPLMDCLAALGSQALAPTEVVVVVHALDRGSAAAVDQLAAVWRQLRRARVEQEGLVAALNCGLAAASGAIVAFVDDDAVPAVDWLQRIVSAFADDERIAAVGGRDVVVLDGRPLTAPPRRLSGWRSPTPDVGRIQWFGKMLGNHHLGVGEARDVDVLKGVNMSFRTADVVPQGFDERLRGEGAQVHSELSICLPLRRRGLRVVYDPGISVTHYPAPRLLGDQRDHFGRDQVTAFTHNETLEILDYLSPLQRFVFTLWGVTIGTSASPGLVALIRDLIARRPEAWVRFSAAQQGRLAAWRTHRIPRSIPAALAAGAQPRERAT